MNSTFSALAALTKTPSLCSVSPGRKYLEIRRRRQTTVLGREARRRRPGHAPVMFSQDPDLSLLVGVLGYLGGHAVVFDRVSEIGVPLVLVTLGSESPFRPERLAVKDQARS